jgi:hypothetical protein
MIEKAAIETARELADENQDDLWEVEGYTIRVKAIPVAIISDVTARIPEPSIPVWHNPEYDRDEQNPNEPGYLKAKEEVDRKRGEAMIDATVMFGIDLPDGVPPTEEWLPKLKFMEKRGQVDLSGYDLSDGLELEFVFKKYIIASIALINYIQNISSVMPEDIDRAGRPFRRPQKR